MKQDTPQPTGFTLIELLVVMAIMVLLMSLVGPLTVKGYERIQAKEEQASLKNWLQINAYRSFATGQTGQFIFEDNQVSYLYQALPQIDENVASDETLQTSQAMPLDAPLPQIISQRSFNYLQFEAQTLRVNAFGLVFPAIVRIKRNNVAVTINLNEQVADVEE